MVGGLVVKWSDQLAPGASFAAEAVTFARRRLRTLIPVSRVPASVVAATVVAAVCVGAAAWLGAWQYRAWDDRRAAEAQDLSSEAPRTLTDVMGNDDPFPGTDVGRPVSVEGTWKPDATVVISDRRHDGAEGYWLVTPLTVGSAGDPAVPVVLGWTASEPTDPIALAPDGAGSVVGFLQPPEGSGVVDDDPTDDVYPQLRVAELAQRSDVDLFSAYVVLDPERTAEPPTDLEAADPAQLPEVGRFTAIRNLLYAAEWWFFGGFAAFIWWRFVRDERAERAAGGSRAVDKVAP